MSSEWSKTKIFSRISVGKVNNLGEEEGEEEEIDGEEVEDEIEGEEEEEVEGLPWTAEGGFISPVR